MARVQFYLCEKFQSIFLSSSWQKKVYNRSHYHSFVTTSFVYLISKMLFFITCCLQLFKAWFQIRPRIRACLNCYINPSLHCDVEQVARCLRDVEQSLSYFKNWIDKCLCLPCSSKTSTSTHGINTGVENTSFLFHHWRRPFRLETFGRLSKPFSELNSKANGHWLFNSIPLFFFAPRQFWSC